LRGSGHAMRLRVGGGDVGGLHRRLRSATQRRRITCSRHPLWRRAQ
jgi:hypothetical protein